MYSRLPDNYELIEQSIIVNYGGFSKEKISLVSHDILDMAISDICVNAVGDPICPDTPLMDGSSTAPIHNELFAVSSEEVSVYVLDGSATSSSDICAMQEVLELKQTIEELNMRIRETMATIEAQQISIDALESVIQSIG